MGIEADFGFCKFELFGQLVDSFGLPFELGTDRFDKIFEGSRLQDAKGGFLQLFLLFDVRVAQRCVFRLEPVDLVLEVGPRGVCLAAANVCGNSDDASICVYSY